MCRLSSAHNVFATRSGRKKRKKEAAPRAAGSAAAAAAAAVAPVAALAPVAAPAPASAESLEAKDARQRANLMEARSDERDPAAVVGSGESRQPLPVPPGKTLSLPCLVFPLPFCRQDSFLPCGPSGPRGQSVDREHRLRQRWGEGAASVLALPPPLSD